MQLAETEYKRAYYQKHKTKLKARAREYYQKNRERILVRDRAYSSRNAEARRLYQKQYRISYGKELNAARRVARAQNPALFMLRHAKRSARLKKIPFALVPEDITVPAVCPVLGLVLAVGEGKRTDASPSLDRLVPNLGYVRGNVRVISWRANNLKSDATLNEMRAVLTYMESIEHGN